MKRFYIIGFLVLMAFDTLAQLSFKQAGNAALPLEFSVDWLARVFGQPWSVAGGGTGNTLANVNYLTVGGVNTNAADARYVCQLDRLMDDGVNTAGIVRSNAAYTAATDCWSRSGQVSIGIRLLP